MINSIKKSIREDREEIFKKVVKYHKDFGGINTTDQKKLKAFIENMSDKEINYYFDESDLWFCQEMKLYDYFLRTNKLSILK